MKGKVWLWVILALVVIVAGVVIWTGQGPKQAGGSQSVKFDPNIFVYVGAGDAETLDPSKAYDTASSEIIFQYYDNLIAYKEGSLDEFVPMLATEVPLVANGLISPDGKTYTFPIRKGVKFHNGAILTPEDVEYSFERNILADPTGGPMWMLIEPLFGVATIKDLACQIAGVDSFEEVDEAGLVATAKRVMDAIEVKGDNVVFHLHAPYPPFLSILARNSSWSVILNKEWMIANGAWDGKPETWIKWHDLPTEEQTLFDKAMGTGPYKQVEWDRSNSKHTMEAHADYWRGPAKIKTVIVNNGVTEFNTRKLMLQKGEADAIYVPVENSPQLEGMEGVTIIRNLPRLSNVCAIFNQEINAVDNEFVGSGKLDGNGIPPDFFSDINIRKAFCYAFDYESFIKEVVLGEASVPYGVIPLGLSDFFDTNGPRYEYNLEKATEYFKKAFNGEVWEKGFKLTLVWNIPNTTRKTACEILEHGIESINPKFQVEVQGMEWATMLPRRREGRLPMVFIGWLADFADPHNFVYPYLHSKGDFMAFTGEIGRKFAEAEFDELVNAGIKESDPAKRKAIYTELQKKSIELAPHLMLYDAYDRRAHRDWVKGYVFDPICPAFYDFYALSKSLDN
ncbi:ABC transporter substrate-binding protein [Capillibacterium thermochitinicola]|uniref:ABC transporter substrate-binding protein n=1 Tax=Capillibacterium thermochitinicola TaxID=2699427 RepID=A0A8J6I240_9FIRM|nr:ABC transporter substrate-binding protein [Capillibacterium thermochitinicola]MBA2132862.1 ABC transporter substrate-binding protein [Capillibacterium thermochitinicola]